MVLLLLESSWEWSDDLERAVSELFSTLGATKVIEDGWQKERHGESFHENRLVASGRAWMTPVYAEVLSKTHHYRDLGYASQEIPRGASSNVSASLFMSKKKDASLPELASIVSTQPTPKWYSPSPLSSLSQVADLEMYRESFRANQWSGPGSAWLSILLWGDQSTLVARKGEEQLFFLVTTLGGVAGIGWPAESFKIGSDTYYRPKDSIEMAELKWLHVWGLEDWEGVGLLWVGPMHLRARHKQRWPVGPIAMAESDRQGLWQLSASKCFGNLSKTPMMQLARHMQVDIMPTNSLFEVVKACVMNAFPDMGAEALAAILAKRTSRSFVYEEFLKTEDAADLLEQSEQKAAKDVVEEVTKTKDALADYTKSYASWRTANVPKPKQKQSRSQSSRDGVVNIGGKAYPKKFPLALVDEQWTDAAVRQLLPPDDSTIYYDRVNMRWQLFWFQSRQTRSASFVKYGHIPAARKLLDTAWERFEALGGACRPWGIGGPSA